MHRDEVVCTKYYLTENGLLYIYDNNRVVEVFNDRGWLRLIVTDE